MLLEIACCADIDRSLETWQFMAIELMRNGLTVRMPVPQCDRCHVWLPGEDHLD